MKKIYFLLIIGFMSFSPAFPQDDLESLLDDAVEEPIQYTSATFKNTHVLNGHSVEFIRPHDLEFRISHRFGQLNTGAYELWGLDQANIHYGFEYGVNDWLNVGYGRGTYQKTYDGFIKMRLLRQSSGKKNRPISMSYFTSIAVNSLNQKELNDYFTNRMAYTHALLIARKFTEKLSLQLSPHFIHRNFVETSVDPNDIFAMGLGGRYKLTKRVSVNFEYFYVVDAPGSYPSQKYYNPLSIGFDIETGGHVFQLHLTNSLAMIEKGFIAETTGNWLDGGVHLGFNISRVFTF
ncbi:MAG: DUF5777 family beta-barrel protein [Bacteroidales bacterium]|nr:DUF5777 family beta-barrel protein [Bacteroidales bacterium]MCF8458998.1 DUF5777 family beta-barrel protein [Bacteroidales bacterium]